MPKATSKTNGNGRKGRSLGPLIRDGLQLGVEEGNGHAGVSMGSSAGEEAAKAAKPSFSGLDTRLKPGANERGSYWLVWQLADSAFPTGGFGHSGGLEAAWQHGEVARTDLPGFFETSLRQCARAAIPLVATVHVAPERLLELDQLCDAFLSNHVANRASRLQGRAFWTAATRAFLPDLAAAPELCHLAPVFGMLTRRMQMDSDTATRLFLFLHLRGLVSSAIRLGIVGPLEAQGIQHRLASVAESIATHAVTDTLDDLAQTAPLFDLWQGAQDRLYSRLFQS